MEHLKMYFLHKMRIFQEATLVYRRVHILRYWDSPFQRKSSVNKISFILPFSEAVYPRSTENPQRGFKRILFIYLNCKEKTTVLVDLYTCEGMFTRFTSHFVICNCQSWWWKPRFKSTGMITSYRFLLGYCTSITKNFRYLKWRNPEPYIRLFWGVGFPYHL